METTPVGFLYFIVILFLIIKRKNTFTNLLLLCATTDLFIEMGFFLKKGETYITFYECSFYTLFLYCFFDYLQNPFNLNKNIVRLNLLYIIPVILLILFPSNIKIADSYRVTWDEVLFEGRSLVHPTITNLVIKTTAKFIFSSFIALYLYTKYKIDNYKVFIHRFSHIINIFLIMGILEFVKNYVGGIEIWGKTTEFLFGTTPSTVYESRQRGDAYELNLFTREASHYAYTLFLCIVIKMGKNVFTKRRALSPTIIVCAALMLLSTSFSTILFLIAFFFLYLLYRWGIQKPKQIRFEKFFLIVGILGGFSSVMAYLAQHDDGFVIGRLLNFVENWEALLDIDGQMLMDDNSTFVRVLSVLQTFKAFFYRPFFGFSLGSVGCHGATAMLFSGIGIIGVYYWTKFYFYTNTLYKGMNPQKELYAFAIFLYFLINSLNSLNLRPFYDTTLLLVIISYTFLFSDYVNKKRASYG